MREAVTKEAPVDLPPLNRSTKESLDCAIAATFFCPSGAPEHGHRPVMANMAGTITFKQANVVVSKQIVKQLKIVKRSNMVATTRGYQVLDLQSSFSYTSFSMFRDYIVCFHKSWTTMQGYIYLLLAMYRDKSRLGIKILFRYDKIYVNFTN